MDVANQLANGTTMVPGSSSLLEVGVVGAICLIFLYAIIHLWRTGRTDGISHADKEKAWAVEREGMTRTHAIDRERLETDHERDLKEHAESYAMRLEEMRDQFLAREDSLRKEYAERMERIANEANRAAEKQNEVLNKIYERFVGPRRGRTGG